jgi:2-methylcitrate dehydratase PrpD
MTSKAAVVPQTRVLTEYLASVRYEDLPDDVVAITKSAIADIVSVALFAGQLPWTQLTEAFALEAGAGGRSAIWGSEHCASAAYSALANGSAAHGIEMDDRSRSLELHNGAAAIPAAIAIADDVMASGKAVILGVVCGYEAAYRIARATRHTIKRHYWVSLRNVFGAAAAAAKVLDLDAERFMHALGIAGSMASGSWEFATDPRGTTVQRLQAGGWSAYCGVMSAQLAARGFTAPETALDGKHGFLKAFSTEADPDIDALQRGLGDTFEILDWEPKRYATWGGAHTALDALRELQDRHPFVPEDIERIVARCSRKVFPSATGQLPESAMAAQYDLRTLLAVACFYDLRDPSIWLNPVWQEARILDLRTRVAPVIDPVLDATFSATGIEPGIEVTIVLHDGSSLSASGATAAHPMTHDELRSKFALLTGSAVPAAKVQHLERGIQALDSVSASPSETLGLTFARQSATV